MEPASNGIEGKWLSISTSLQVPIQTHQTDTSSISEIRSRAFERQAEPRDISSVKNRVDLLMRYNEGACDHTFHQGFLEVFKDYLNLSHEQKDDLAPPLAKLCGKFSEIIKANRLFDFFVVGIGDRETFQMLLEVTNRLAQGKNFDQNPDFSSFEISSWLSCVSTKSSEGLQKIYAALIKAVKNYQIYVKALSRIQGEDSTISFAHIESSVLLFSATWIRFSQKLQKSKLGVKPSEEHLKDITDGFNQIRKYFRDRNELDLARRSHGEDWNKLTSALGLYPTNAAIISLRIRAWMVRGRLGRKLKEQGRDPSSDGQYFIDRSDLAKSFAPFLNLPLVNPIEFIFEKTSEGLFLEDLDELPSRLLRLREDLEKLLDNIAQDWLQVVELDIALD